MAAENIDITIESKTAQQREAVDINIELTNNSGVLAMLFELAYDTSRLKLTGAKDSGLDLSSTSDITAFVLVFPPRKDDEIFKTDVFDEAVFAENADHIVINSNDELTVYFKGLYGRLSHKKV